MSVERPGDEAGRWGRRAAAVIYWLGIAYIVVVGFRSIVPAVFWPGSGDRDTQAGRDGQGDVPGDRVEPMGPEQCREEVTRLRGSLVDRAATHVRAGGSAAVLGADGPSTEPDLHRFFAEWDRDWLAVRAGCDSPALGTLERLRHQLETTLHRYDREEGQLLERLHAQVRTR